MVFGDGVFGKQSGLNEVMRMGAPMMSFLSLKKEKPEFSPSTMRRHSEKGSRLQDQKTVLTKNLIYQHPDLRLSGLQICEE